MTALAAVSILTRLLKSALFLQSLTEVVDMIIRVSEIPDEGLRIEGPDSLGRPFVDPAWTLTHVDLMVERDGDAVFVRGRLGARVPQVCGRCLEPFVTALAPEVEARFLPAPSGRAEERELGSDDLETDVYMHDQLDLGALVETETNLVLPMKPLCREECRGLCPVCGGNRNVTACGCPERGTDARWAPLKGLADRLTR